jgi:hypothetical protein
MRSCRPMHEVGDVVYATRNIDSLGIRAGMRGRVMLGKAHFVFVHFPMFDRNADGARYALDRVSIFGVPTFKLHPAEVATHTCMFREVML